MITDVPHPTPHAGTHSDSGSHYTYSLKIINPKKEISILKKFRKLGMFSSLREVRLSILTECEGLVQIIPNLILGTSKLVVVQQKSGSKVKRT